MALILEQVGVTTSAAILVPEVPPGPCTLVLTNTGTAPVAVGTSNAVTVANGALIPPNGVITITFSSGAAGEQLWAIAAAATQAVGVFIATTG